ncbi:uncharacterized protein LOC123524149 isoform X2 [Mercenaria mercenaria]|uniref:uncharacterized protein LOC123524149 isoform X2 n=1 Tax=Mercenaria mercenaria TaxID=6596 RepID=UPI00234F8478|nr:uncharacterized protein LOC123524149 isoform X2 [Mercenaria mercenaria]
MGFRILTVLLAAFAVYSMVTCLPSNDWHFKGQNVAFGKTASQKPATFTEKSYPYTLYPASLAVDGNDDNDFSKKSCSRTTFSYPEHIAQWRVDLGGTYDVTGIIIVNRKDYRERLKYFIIYGRNYNTCWKWCELYNDRNNSAYNNATIRIAINNRQSYHKVAINLPKIDGVPDSGGFNLTLCEVKIFEAPRHVCKVPKPSDKRHVVIYETTGLLVNGMYTVGTILQFYCDDGFLINGSNFVKCLSGGEFNQTLPVCTAACKNMTIDNGRMYPLQTLYNVNSHATIECSVGFLPQRQEIICLYGGYWNQYEQCKQVLCDYPGRPNNGYYISNSTNSISEFSSLPFGSIITGRCYDGYESNDNDKRVCQINKTWSGIPFTCKATAEASQAGLIGGITAPLVCLLLVSLVVVFFVRRRMSSPGPVVYINCKLSTNKAWTTIDTYIIRPS